jgi:DNA-binding SARP family transcriptional activator
VQPFFRADDRSHERKALERTLLRHHHRNDAATAPGQAGRVHITLLGGFGVAVDGVLTPARGWSRRTAAAVVKVLALAPGHRLHREQLMDLLWPNESPERCAPRLHKAAHYARQAAGCPDAVVLRDDMVWLFPGADVTVDAIQFERLAARAVADEDAVAAHEALACYGGELLPADRYEDWAVDRRELLHLRRLELLRVAGEWRELAEADPTDEEAQGELLRRHLAAGDAVAALRQYEHFERTLERELGVAPAASGSRVRALLAELADLVYRQRAVLAELAAAGSAT